MFSRLGNLLLISDRTVILVVFAALNVGSCSCGFTARHRSRGFSLSFNGGCRIRLDVAGLACADMGTSICDFASSLISSIVFAGINEIAFVRHNLSIFASIKTSL